MEAGYEKIGVFRPIILLCFENGKNMAIVTIEDEQNSYTIYRMVPFPMTLSDP